MQTYDKLWKGIIEDLFDDFIYFFYEKWAEKIDFTKGFEFLDQELAQLFPELENDNRAIDKLVKVYLKDGTEEWILIHIEVQGYEDNNFGVRMFTYNYRVFDRYKKKISAIAIFTDKKKGYQPNTYHTECLGTEMIYRFRTYKVLDQNEKILEQSNNPFAIVILATLAAIKKGKKNDVEIMDIKRQLVRLLYERKYSKKKIISLFMFIQTYIRFEKPENYSIFADEISSIYEPKQKNMGLLEIIKEDIDLRNEAFGPFIEQIRKQGLEQVRKQGLEQGLVQGLEQGLVQGREQGIFLVVTKLITSFPDWDNDKIADLAGTTIEVVQKMRLELSK